MKESSHNKPPSEIVMSTPGGASIATTRSSSKRAATNDFSDSSVQAFKDIAATMKEKHSTDKMFRLLAMEGVSPNTKKNIQDVLLSEFRSTTVVAPTPAGSKKQKSKLYVCCR
jgi:hypothetical protein